MGLRFRLWGKGLAGGMLGSAIVTSLQIAVVRGAFGVGSTGVCHAVTDYESSVGKPTKAHFLAGLPSSIR